MERCTPCSAPLLCIFGARASWSFRSGARLNPLEHGMAVERGTSRRSCSTRIFWRHCAGVARPSDCGSDWLQLIPASRRTCCVRPGSPRLGKPVPGDRLPGDLDARLVGAGRGGRSAARRRGRGPATRLPAPWNFLRDLLAEASLRTCQNAAEARVIGRRAVLSVPAPGRAA